MRLQAVVNLINYIITWFLTVACSALLVAGFVCSYLNLELNVLDCIEMIVSPKDRHCLCFQPVRDHELDMLNIREVVLSHGVGHSAA